MGTDRSAHVVHMVELAARELPKEKNKDVRKCLMGRYDSTTGDDYGYNFNSFPNAVFWRKGYKHPKKYSGKIDYPAQLVDWIRHEVQHVYMKDDSKIWERGELVRGEEL